MGRDTAECRACGTTFAGGPLHELNPRGALERHRRNCDELPGVPPRS